MTEIIIISIVVAIVAAAGVCIGVIRHYKRGLYSPIYPLEHYTNMNLSTRSDRFLYKNVTRVKVASSKKND